MNFSCFRTSLMISIFASAVAAFAQEPMPARAATPSQAPVVQLPEDDIPVEIIPTLNTTFSFGLRRVGRGPKVRFGNLGTVPQDFQFGSDGVSRVYSDGAFIKDALRFEEVLADGTPITEAMGLVTNKMGSQTRRTGNTITVFETVQDSGGTNIPNVQTMSYNAFDARQTRHWNYASTEQFDATTRTIKMSTYGAESTGGEASAESSSGSGFDLQLSYTLGRVGKRFEWGVSAGFSLTDFSASTSGTVVSTLLQTMDSYRLGGTNPNPALNQPGGNGADLPLLVDGTTNPITVVGADGSPTTVAPGGDETGATPLETALLSSQDLFGIVLVDGFWQLKGAYYTVRLGPSFRYYVTEKFALSGNAGFAFTYVGATYRANEELTGLNVTAPVRVQDVNTTQAIVPGCYADVNAEYWVSERTGFYFGWGYQNLGEFEQKRLKGRSAKMDLGNSNTYRFGIITRF